MIAVILILILIFLAILFPNFMRMMVRIVVVLIIIAALKSAAHGATLPVHDVDALCHRSVAREGFNQCARARQYEYEMVLFYWPHLTETEQSDLLKQAYTVAEDTRGPFPNDDAHKAVIYGYMLPFIHAILDKREARYR